MSLKTPNIIPATCWQSLAVNSRQLEGGELTAAAAAPERGQKSCYVLHLWCLVFFSRNLQRTVKETLKPLPLLIFFLFSFFSVFYSRFSLSRTNYRFISYYCALSPGKMLHLFLTKQTKTTPPLQRQSLFRLKLSICNAPSQ